MKILHICNDYTGSRVHYHLCKELEKLGVTQTIFTYYKKKSNKAGKNYINSDRCTIYYMPIISWYYKFFYHIKNRIIYRHLINTIQKNITSYTCIHASTLFTDGGIAYRVKKKYNIRYVVCVRSTDVDSFLVMAPHAWIDGIKILLNAERIFFPSVSLKNKFCKHWFIRMFLNQISFKLSVVPNGIDEYWLHNIVHQKLFTTNLLFIGSLIKRKNILRVIKAANILNKEFPNIKLYIVGDGPIKKKCEKIASYNPNVIYCGPINEKDKLKDLFKRCGIFVMPSWHETFGLVYVEALSQNLKLLFSKGTGIDGLLDDKVGVAVNPHSLSSIIIGLKSLILKKDYTNPNRNVDFCNFDWSCIAKKYYHTYLEILEHK